LSRRRFDRDFDGYSDHDCNGPRGYRGPAGIFGLVFSFVSLGLTIAFNVLGMVLHVFSGLAGSKPAKNYEMPPQAHKQQAAEEKKNTTSQDAANRDKKNKRCKSFGSIKHA